MTKIIKNFLFFMCISFVLAGCKNGKLPGADARKIPYDPKERVKEIWNKEKDFV